jgi:uncharacterized protein
MEQDKTAQTRQWAMFLHFSLLAGFIVPIAGWVVPIIIWQVKKTDLPDLDIHGKIVVNWLISSLIYWAIGVLLAIIAIGIVILLALGVVTIVFPLIGGIKANNGEIWKYPFSMKFLK